MTNKNTNDPWAPWDQNAHAKDMEQHDQFNRLTDDAIPVLGGLRTKLQELVATNNEAQEVLAREGIELPTIAKQFRLSQGEIGTIVADSKGLWTASIVVDGQTLTFQSEDRDSAMMAVERYLEKNRGPRDLTASEALRVARLAQSGASAQAIELYVDLRLNGKDHRNAEDILTDPALVGLLNDAARFVWSYTRPDYVPARAFDQLLDEISATRVLTVNSVDILFDRFQEQQAAAARAPRRAAQADAPESEHIPTRAEVQNELENLPDGAIDKLRRETMRHRGQIVRQFDETVLGR
jgi:hypothetical protein